MGRLFFLCSSTSVFSVLFKVKVKQLWYKKKDFQSHQLHLLKRSKRSGRKRRHGLLHTNWGGWSWVSSSRERLEAGWWGGMKVRQEQRTRVCLGHFDQGGGGGGGGVSQVWWSRARPVAKVPCEHVYAHVCTHVQNFNTRVCVSVVTCRPAAWTVRGVQPGCAGWEVRLHSVRQLRQNPPEPSTACDWPHADQREVTLCLM